MHTLATCDEKSWSPAVEVHDSPERGEFLAHYLPLVKSVVCRIVARLPRGQDVQDLIGEGTLGLLDAVNRFDPRKAIPFGVYARQRIRGTVLDRLRQDDPLSRSARERHDRIRSLAGDTAGPRSQEELASALGVPVRKLMKTQPAPVFFSLDEALASSAAGGDRESAEAGRAGASEFPNPLGTLLARENVELVRRALAGLSDRERQLLSLYYVEELTMKEVGEILGITESRVCQIHRRALELTQRRLRLLMEDGKLGGCEVAAS